MRNGVCYNESIKSKGGKCDEGQNEKTTIFDNDFRNDTYSVSKDTSF